MYLSVFDRLEWLGSLICRPAHLADTLLFLPAESNRGTKQREAQRVLQPHTLERQNASEQGLSDAEASGDR